MRRVLSLWLLLGACSDGRHVEPPKPSAQVHTASAAQAKVPAFPPLPQERLLAGQFPDGAEEMNLLRSRCVICHGLEYITQQRLTPAQWDKTIAKMRKWGAPVGDEEAKALGAFLAHYWVPELRDRSSPLVPTPALALSPEPPR